MLNHKTDFCVRFSDHHSGSGPLDIQTLLDHGIPDLSVIQMVTVLEFKEIYFICAIFIKKGFILEILTNVLADGCQRFVCYSDPVSIFLCARIKTRNVIKHILIWFSLEWKILLIISSLFNMYLGHTESK